MRNIGLSIGQVFAEIQATSDEKEISQRFYLPQRKLLSSLDQFFERNPNLQQNKISIHTHWARDIIHKKAGSQIALFVTTGFEKWPILQQKQNRSDFHKLPQRPSSFLSKDFIFGIRERLNEKGEVICKPDLQELEFLVAKLKMMGIQHVAVGFLHSQINPEHELFVKSFLESKKIHCVCSHEFDNEVHEVARWWRTLLEVYVVDSLQQQVHEKLQPLFEKYNLKAEFSKSEPDTHLGLSLNSNFGKIESFANCFRDQDLVLYFGTEEFLYLLPKEQDDVWTSPLGSLALKNPRHHRFSIQPTTEIEPNAWDSMVFSSNESSFDPGPILLGRGSNASWLDLLVLLDQLPDFYKESQHPKARLRIKENIIAYSHEANEKIPVEDWAQELLNISKSKMMVESQEAIAKAKKILVTGPMSHLFYSEFRKHFGQKIELDPKAEFIDSYTAGDFCETFES